MKRIACGSRRFIEEEVKQRLGFEVKENSTVGIRDDYRLREDIAQIGHTSGQGSDPGSDAGETYTIRW